MKKLSFVLLLFVGLIGCKTPSSVSSTTNGSSMSTSSANTAQTTEAADADAPAEGVDFPFDNRLENIEAATTDTRKVVMSFGYSGHVKPGVVNQRIYVIETLEPLIRRAAMKVISSKTAEDLSEGNWSEVKSEIFREVQSVINPQEVKVKELKAIQITLR